VIYVDDDATGANDGLSWASAYNYLQDALADADAAVKPVEIWVTEGVYKPDQSISDPNGTGDRTASFQLINNVAFYGGFTSGGTWETRDPNTYETILSGDIGTLANPNDNCYHVFYHPGGLLLEHTAVLDGFTITGGNANGPREPDGHDVGGGMYNCYSHPTVTHCVFNDNTASYHAGGMWNYQSSPLIKKCDFSGNSALDSGGGMYNYANSNPVIEDSDFSCNSALGSGYYDGGGGVFNFSVNSGSSSKPKFINCIFSGNTAHKGGGMFNHYSSPELDGCSFSRNSTDNSGGGVYNATACPRLMNCTFTYNVAETGGGGIVNMAVSSPTVKNCIFLMNSAVLVGGGIENEFDCNGTFMNCIISGNCAGSGGGVKNGSNSSPRFMNCIFSDNSAGLRGGGLFINMGEMELNHCVLWGNTAKSGHSISMTSESFVGISYCNIQGGQSSIYSNDTCTIDWGEGNIDEEPLLTPDGHLRKD